MSVQGDWLLWIKVNGFKFLVTTEREPAPNRNNDRAKHQQKTRQHLAKFAMPIEVRGRLVFLA
jgi:hypothetical protein